MPTKQTGKKTAQAKKTDAPAKGKKTAPKRPNLDEGGGGEPKNATGS